MANTTSSSGADRGATLVDAHVGSRVRLRRTTLGLSRESLAEQVGVSWQQVVKYEQGETRIGVGRLYDLSQALGVEVGFFFDDMPGRDEPARTMNTDDRITMDLVQAFSDIMDRKVQTQIVRMVRSFTDFQDRIVGRDTGRRRGQRRPSAA